MLETLHQEFLRIWPTAALLLGVVLGGLILASIARRVIRWAVDRSGLDALAERAGAARLLHALGIRQGVAHVLGSLAWFGGVILTGAAAADILGLQAVADGAAAILGFLPRMLTALLVFGAGAALAGLLRRLATGFAHSRGDVDHPELLGNLVYYAVLTVVVLVALEQAGVETALVQTLLITLTAIVGAAIALAFALGSRHSFHNLVAGHFLQRLARPGDTVRIGGVEGVVLRYFGVSVILRTQDGEIAVPCKRLLEENIGLRRLGAKARAAAPDLNDDPNDDLNDPAG